MLKYILIAGTLVLFGCSSNSFSEQGKGISEMRTEELINFAREKHGRNWDSWPDFYVEELKSRKPKKEKEE